MAKARWEEEEADILPWLNAMYYLDCIVALVTAVFTCIDLSTSSQEQQISGEPETFPRFIYIGLIATFYALAIMYAFLKWYYFGDIQRETYSIEEHNKDWNILTFTIVSLPVILYALIVNLNNTFIIAAMFTMQVCCVSVLILFSWIKSGL